MLYKLIAFCTFICLLLTACMVSQIEKETPTPSPPTLTTTTPATSAPPPTEIPPTITPLPPAVLPIHALPDPIILFKGEGPEIYLVEKPTWTHRHIVDGETFLHLGFTQNDIETSPRFANYPEGPPITRLLKGSSERVYWMENGLRHHIPDMETFLHLGHQQEDIAEIPDALLATWPLGDPLPSVLGTPAEPVPLLSQERVVLTRSHTDRFGSGTHTDEIYTVYTDGTWPRRLSHATASYTVHSGPAWSPDGCMIIFASTPDSNTNTASIAVTPFDTWNPTRLTENGVQHPIWSPDGAHIAYLSWANTPGVYVMDANGDNPQWLAHGIRPAWTPEGRIAFCAGIVDYAKTPPPLTLTVMDSDGQNQQVIDQSITVLVQQYYPWREEVWIAGGSPCTMNIEE